MPLNLKPHEYKRRPNTNTATLIRHNPYVAFARPLQPTIFLQGGIFYGQAGHELDPDDVPEDVMEAVALMSPEARKAVGYKVEAEDVDS